MRTLRLAFVVFYFSLAHVQAQESAGIIVGKVLNEQDQPVAHAEVCVGRTEVEDKHSQRMVIDCRTKTDEVGQFGLEDVSMGTVDVRL
jgi:hypothetical protein